MDENESDDSLDEFKCLKTRGKKTLCDYSAQCRMSMLHHHHHHYNNKIYTIEYYDSVQLGYSSFYPFRP